jgi:hypothetical protein
MGGHFNASQMIVKAIDTIALTATSAVAWTRYLLGPMQGLSTAIRHAPALPNVLRRTICHWQTVQTRLITHIIDV